MKYKLKGHRHALSIVTEPEFRNDWKEFIGVIESISDEMLASVYVASSNENAKAGRRKPMSLSRSINTLIDEGLVAKGWNRQSKIFGDSRFEDKRWTLDFAKTKGDLLNGEGTFSVEIAFNNAGSTAWNLIKPVLASELNHVSKAIQTKVGIVVFATEALKSAGCFDATVGTFEAAEDYLAAMQNIIVTPIVIVGLDAPQSFEVQEQEDPDRKYKYGKIAKTDRKS
jgi:hypothetical protein